MTIDHEFKIAFADGTEIDTFDEFAITHDMLAAGSAWTLALWYSPTARSTWDILKAKAKNGALVVMSVDDATQLVGMIEVREEHEARDSGEVMVLSGRDLAGIAMDWDADPNIQLRNEQLDVVLGRILEPTGLRIGISDANAARDVQGIPRRRHSNGRRAVARQQVDRFRIKPGEKMWSVCDRVVRQLGLMMWTAPQVETNTLEVVVDTPLETGDPTFRFARIEQDDGTFVGNILRGSHKTTIRGIPTEVTGYAHTRLSDGQDARVQRAVFNQQLTGAWVVDDPLPQPRFLSRDQAHTQDQIDREAQREIAKAMASFRTYECDVQGLGQDVNGSMRLYTINTLARVRDDRRGIDEVMLITAVTMKRSRHGGTVATVRMSPRGAIKAIPERTQ